MYAGTLLLCHQRRPAVYWCRLRKMLRKRMLVGRKRRRIEQDSPVEDDQYVSGTQHQNWRRNAGVCHENAFLDTPTLNGHSYKFTLVCLSTSHTPLPPLTPSVICWSSKVKVGAQNHKWEARSSNTKKGRRAVLFTPAIPPQRTLSFRRDFYWSSLTGLRFAMTWCRTLRMG